jgi:UDP-2,4-diacetamido-2,4,6-trideoxy-beta-L-altropyranose hydrolase
MPKSGESILLILTEAGPTIGLGHLVRCSSLADEFRAGHWVVRGLVFTEGSELRLPDGFQKYDWHAGGDQADYLKLADLVIVDSYIATDFLVEALLKKARNAVFIDDVIRREYDSGSVVDWTIGAEKRSFVPRNNGVNYFLGKEYCCLRSEFAAPARRRVGLNAVLVTFGGSDVRSLTKPVLKMLCSELPGVTKRIVVGAGARDRTYYLEEWPHCQFFFDCSAKEMRDVMDASSIAVCAGGQTLYEMAARGLPPIAIGIMDSQMEDIEGFVAEGFVTFAGKWNEPDILGKLWRAVSSMEDSTKIMDRSAKGIELIDGLGAKRLYTALMNAVPRNSKTGSAPVRSRSYSRD